MQQSERDARVVRLAALAVEEAELVLQLLPAACDVQFERPPGRGERDETGRSATGGHSDPTADLATDPHRLYLREVLQKSEPHLAEAVAKLGGIRRGLERALRPWDGPN